MSLDDVLNLSRAVEDRLFACKDLSVCQNIMFVLSFGNEVRTDEMIKRSLKGRKQVYVPRLITRERRMEVCAITDMDQEFELGSYDIREPSRSNSKVVSPSKIDAVIAPGLAFDRSGARIGFGGGILTGFLNSCQMSRFAWGLPMNFKLGIRFPRIPGMKGSK